MLTSIAAQIGETALSKDIAGSDYAFALIECVHVVVLCLVYGSIAIVDLRLLNVRFGQETVSGLTRRVLPVTWTAFAIAVVSGTFLFISEPDRLVNNGFFIAKMGLMFLAGLNMLVFHLVVQRNQDEWDRPGPTPAGARASGAISLTLWTLIIFVARWIGFT